MLAQLCCSPTFDGNIFAGVRF